MLFKTPEFTAESIGKMFPAVPPEHREEAAYNYSRYLRVVARIFDQMVREDRVPKYLHRLAEKRRKQREREERKGLR